MTQTAKKSLVTTRSAVIGEGTTNEVAFTGYLGRDPEMSYTPNGKSVTKFSIGVWQGKDKDSMWLNVTCWENLAEEANNLLKTGLRVEVRGRLTQRKWENKYYHDVVAESIEIIEKGAARNTKRVPQQDTDPLGDLGDHPF